VTRRTAVPINGTLTGLKPKGTLIGVDGSDGAGKSTLVKAMIAQLLSQGASVATFQSFVTDRNGYFWETYLAMEKAAAELGEPVMTTAFAQMLHAYNMICLARTDLPSLLAENDFVIADRYLLARLALARLTTGQPHSEAEMLVVRSAKSGVMPMPDHTIYLSVDAAEAHRRVVQRGEPTELRETLPELRRVLTLYNEILEDPGLRCLLGQVHNLCSMDSTAEELAQQFLSQVYVPAA